MYMPSMHNHLSISGILEGIEYLLQRYDLLRPLIHSLPDNAIGPETASAVNSF